MPNILVQSKTIEPAKKFLIVFSLRPLRLVAVD
jgi:hypothetical protein